MPFLRNALLGIVLLTLLLNKGNSQEVPEWLNPTVFSSNTLPATSLPIPYENESEVKKSGTLLSSRTKMLSGTWKFKWFKNSQLIPKNFLSNHAIQHQDWDPIVVPSYWQIEGIASKKPYDKPYFNRTIPDSLSAPETLVKSDSNAVGIYLTHFTVPHNWYNNTILLHFEGVRSACYVWINGQKVGYHENSGSSFSFQIDSLLKKGDNQLAVQVLKWSDGSFLENRDSWQISGIYKDVYLTMHQDVRIEDVATLADLDEQYKDGKLSIRATIRNSKNHLQYNQRISMAVYDEAFNLVSDFKIKSIDVIDSTAKYAIQEVIYLPGIQKWNAEQPSLYNLVVQLKDNQGQILETVVQKIGFRKISYQTNQLLINGKAVTIKGVNLTTIAPSIYTLDRIHQELRLMKQHNINAIWINGDTACKAFYDLCDYYGFYVIDQVNIHTAFNTHMQNRTDWAPTYLARARRIWERNKNHPSIIGWAIASHTHQDQNLTSVKEYLALVDPSRPLLYRNDHDVTTHYHIVTSSALTATSLQQLPKDINKPTLLSSIGTTHGNGLGDLKQLWQAILSSPARQGGFIDNWSSNTIIYPAPDHLRRFYRNYAPGYFPKGGVVSSMGHPEPELLELKKTFESILLLTADTIDLHKRLVIVTNKFDFRQLNDFNLQWSVLENGKVIQSGMLPLTNIKPNESKELKLPIEWPPQPRIDGHYYLQLAVVTKHNLSFCPEGFEIAKKQVPLRIMRIPQSINVQASAPLRMNFLRGIGIEIAGSNFSITFDKETAQISSFVYNDKEYIESGLSGNFWRVPVVIDQLGAKLNVAQIWKAHGLDSLKTISSDLRVEKVHTHVFKVTAVKRVGTKFGSIQLNSIYTIFSSGDVQAHYSFIPHGTLPPLPRLGLQMTLRENMEKITWFGRGPHENYADRKTSAFIGLYSGNIKDQHHDYSTLQENGNKSDVQWFAIQDIDQDGLLFISDSLVNFNIQNYTAYDMLTAQKTKSELTRGLQNTLYIDLIHEGLNFNFHRNGSEVFTPTSAYRFSFRIKPVNAQSDFFKEANMKLPIVIKKSVEMTNHNEKE